MQLRPFAIVIALGAIVLCGRGLARADEKEPTKEGVEFFEKNIRPVLSESCYRCHSQDAADKKKLKAKLKLDSWEGIAKGGDSGDPGVTPGDPEKSAIIKSIRYQNKGDDEGLNMPPKNKKTGAGGKLPDDVIKKFEEWVKMGAPYPKDAKKSASTGGRADAGASARADAESTHWAFVKPVEPKLPAVKNVSWVKNPIDQLVLAKLEALGLQPSHPADKPTLLRRVTLDLTGLPPTADDVRAFVNDASPDAYEKVVDRLLDSPRYGERWARHWLDVARYSDTKGYVFREERRYPYAYTYRDWVINAFNTDLPYDQFLIQQIAADKLNLGDDKRPLAAMGFLTVGRRFLNSSPDIIDDRIDVVCRGTMGLTVGCARCHDHKFDPIPTSDYYSLYGIFDSSTEPKQLPQISSTEPTPASIAFENELKAREAAADDYLRSKVDDALNKMRAPKAIAAYLVAATPQASDEAVDRADLNRSMINRWRMYLGGEAGANSPIFKPWHAYAALPATDFATKAAAVSRKLFATDAKPPINPLIAAEFADKPPTSIHDVAERYAAVLATADSTKPADDESTEMLRQVLRGDKSPYALKTDKSQELLALVKRDVLEEFTNLRNKAEAFIATSPDAPARAMVLVDAPNPHDAAIHMRGNAGNPGRVVPRHFLEALCNGTPTAFKDGSGRLELARAIASRDNPLTARVFVNRVWIQHFGRGIVRTPSDFGTRSDPPTHPEVLDFLAVRFMDSGWSIKKLQKLIVTSATYQQAVDGNPDPAAANKVDPENFLLWRMNRQRLDFESLRDTLLAVSKSIDLTVGGRGFDLADASSGRRTVYATIDRQNLPNLFRSFDFASPDASAPQRFTTTVPQQALFFLNSPFVLKQAKALASLPEVASAANADARIRALYLRAFARLPAADELGAAREFIKAEAAAQPEPLVASAAEVPTTTRWQYGVGAFDEQTGKVVGFQPLPHFTGSSWQGSMTMPDAKLSFAMLTARGGHPGADGGHAVIRRWIAPADGVAGIAASLKHPAMEGDGVRGRIVSSRSGLVGEWVASHSRVDTSVPSMPVKKGDRIDFVVDCRSSDTSDTFTWAPTVRVTRLDGRTIESNAAVDFESQASSAAPATPTVPATPWEKLAQVLLESNEFIFVD